MIYHPNPGDYTRDDVHSQAIEHAGPPIVGSKCLDAHCRYCVVAHMEPHALVKE